MAKRKTYKGEQDIKDWFDLELRGRAIDINKNLQYAARSVIQYFYDDYTPFRYKRIWDFNADNFLKTILRKEKNGYVCGVIMTSDALHDHPQSDADVFELVVEHGIHGKTDTYITSPSPSQMMDSYYDKLSYLLSIF